MELRIGRAKDNEIVIDDPSVSRHHATLIVNGNSYVVRDNGSTNGTFINARRIAGDTQMEYNDILKVGEAIVPWRNYLHFRKPGSTAANPVMPQRQSTIPSMEATRPAAKKKNKTALILSVVLVTMLGGVGVFFMSRGSSDTEKMIGTWKCDGDCPDAKELHFHYKGNDIRFEWMMPMGLKQGIATIDRNSKEVILDIDDQDENEVWTYSMEGDELSLHRKTDSTEIKVELNKKEN